MAQSAGARATATPVAPASGQGPRGHPWPPHRPGPTRPANRPARCRARGRWTGVGPALQGVLSNVVAGLSIIFTKPYRVGEHISLLGVHGDVAKIDIFTSTLLHPDHSRIVIPNRKVVGEILHNFGTIRQLNLSIGVSYRTDINRTLDMLRSLVRRLPLVL